MIKLFTTTVLLFSLTILTAQRPGGQRQGGQQANPITITGTVLDQETNQPLEYATLVLQSTRNPDRITGGISDATGKFSVETLPGRYNVRVEYLSFKTYKLEAQT